MATPCQAESYLCRAGAETGSSEVTWMLLNAVFKRFAELTPMCVAARVVLESALCPEELDQLFQDTARQQYTRTLLFSTCVELMVSVVCRVHRSVHAAYRASLEKSAVSIKSIYNELEHLEPNLSAELVRHTARKLAPVIRRMKGGLPPLLPGYRVKILNGNRSADPGAKTGRLAAARFVARSFPIPSGIGIHAKNPSRRGRELPGGESPGDGLPVSRLSAGHRQKVVANSCGDS